MKAGLVVLGLLMAIMITSGVVGVFQQRASRRPLTQGVMDSVRSSPLANDKSWTISARMDRAARLQDSLFGVWSPRAIEEARQRGIFTDTAHEIPGVIEVRTGPFFRKATEIEREGLANSFIHEATNGDSIVVYVDGKTGKLLSCYRFGSRVR
jgi:hypothetical protein